MVIEIFILPTKATQKQGGQKSNVGDKKEGGRLFKPIHYVLLIVKFIKNGQN